MHNIPFLVISHAVLASVALVLGPVSLFRRRKGDILHRALGYVWVAAMCYVSVSSFWIRTLNNGRLSWIHILSVVMLLSIAGGLISARLHQRQTHRGFMIGSYLGLWGAFVPAALAPGRLIPRLAENAPGKILVAVIVVLVLTLALFTISQSVAKWIDRRGT